MCSASLEQNLSEKRGIRSKPADLDVSVKKPKVVPADAKSSKEMVC